MVAVHTPGPNELAALLVGMSYMTRSNRDNRKKKKVG